MNKELNYFNWILLHRRAYKHFLRYPIFSSRLLAKRLAYTCCKRFTGYSLRSPKTSELLWCNQHLLNYWAMHMVREYPDQLEKDLRTVVSPTIIDVGSNIGMFGNYVSNINPTSKVITIDPQPEMKAKYDFAISDVDYDVIALTKGGDAFSAGTCYNEGEEFSSLTRTLDSLFYNLPNVFLLKIDIDGGEREALAGAKKLLERTKHVLIEYSGTDELLIEGFSKPITVNGFNYYYTRL